jgi:hypothetical protein
MCQPNGADGQLIVWDSGGAELDVGRLGDGDTRFARYDLASATDVHALRMTYDRGTGVRGGTLVPREGLALA